jgi:hypothetical protein
MLRGKARVGMHQGDLKIRKKLPNFSKIAPKVAKSKRPKYLQQSSI